MQAVLCPHCKKEFEISQALHDQVVTQVQQEEKENFQKELERVRLEEKNKTEKRIREQSELEVKDLQNERKTDRDRIEKLMRDVLTANDAMRELKQKEEEREIENQKKLADETKKIHAFIAIQEEEKSKFKLLEKEQQLEMMKKTIQDLQRKVEQNSQQIQGEVLEIELEAELRKSFPHDSIEAVGKGISGSDIRHIVKTPLGHSCGVILWECKRTKAWSDGWITKLKEDMIKETENTVSVIVSTALPLQAKSGMCLLNRVWVTNFPLAVCLAQLIRSAFLNVAKQKKVMENSSKKADLLYSFVTSFEFKQQVEFTLETYAEMSVQVQKERVAYEKYWKIREAQIQKLFTSTAQVVGGIEGRIGDAMPQIKGLDVLEIDKPRNSSV